MTTVFLEPGGDASFDTATTLTAFTPANAILSAPFGTLSIVADFVHGAHVKSLQPPASGVNGLEVRTLGDTGRESVYLYLATLPSATANLLKFTNSAAASVFRLRITSAGALQLWEATAQIGSNGSTLSTGVWYRLSVCWNLTSTSVNEFRVYKNGGTADISVSNATLGRVGTTRCRLGNSDADTLDCRLSDIYFDDSSSASDIATDLWVTAKRPNANGSVNGFTTQVGSGGSGYGSGHSPQVNERPSSLTNGWSMIGAGSAVTEEYSVEGAATGDIAISGATIIDYMGWVFAKSLASETAQIVVGGTATNISLPLSAQQAFMQPKGSSSYPAGGTDIGIITDTSLTTVSLYECGLMFAYTPSVNNVVAPTSAALATTGTSPVLATVTPPTPKALATAGTSPILAVVTAVPPRALVTSSSPPVLSTASTPTGVALALSAATPLLGMAVAPAAGALVLTLAQASIRRGNADLGPSGSDGSAARTPQGTASPGATGPSGRGTFSVGPGGTG